jgi:hypothetical protein
MEVMLDESAKLRDRLEASRLLADRGWGKAPLLGVGTEARPEDAPRQVVVERPRTRQRMIELLELARELGV